MITIESIQNGRKYRKKKRNTERYNEIKEGRKEKRKNKERKDGRRTRIKKKHALLFTFHS